MGKVKANAIHHYIVLSQREPDMLIFNQFRIPGFFNALRNKYWSEIFRSKRLHLVEYVKQSVSNIGKSNWCVNCHFRDKHVRLNGSSYYFFEFRAECIKLFVS